MRKRPIPLALTGLIAVVSAAGALAWSGGHDMSAHAAAGHAHAAPSPAAFALRTDMRQLWEEHVTWTRLAIISLTTDAPDTTETVNRLLRNQTDIGNAIKPFYGAAAGRQLTALLRQHILIAAQLIAAARKGDATELAKQQARWTANADQIAAFLHHANPAWKLGPTKAMMHDHLRLTTNEVVARLKEQWAADVRACDKIEVQALHMADMLSAGIVQQFPRRFGDD